MRRFRRQLAPQSFKALHQTAFGLPGVTPVKMVRFRMLITDPSRIIRKAIFICLFAVAMRASFGPRLEAIRQ